VVEELLAAVAAREGGARRERGERRRQVRQNRPPVPCDRAYAALGLARGASPEEVKAAHRRLVKRHHPDMGGRAEDFHRINAAYRLLSV
jgi:DnaJ-class molecular chaperone